MSTASLEVPIKTMPPPWRWGGGEQLLGEAPASAAESPVVKN